MKIYTKSGDNQTTSIGNKRVSKDHIIVEVNGTVDELTSNLMVCFHLIDDEKVKDIIKNICVNLTHLSFEIITKKEYITNEHVGTLEKLIDEYDEKLPKLTNFILPGSNLASAHLHVSRTVCRRLERKIVALGKGYRVSQSIYQYLNRLSDLLFVLARFIGKEDILIKLVLNNLNS